MYKQMVKCDITLNNGGLHSTLNSDETLKKIVRRLPTALRNKWIDKACTVVKTEGCEARFSHLLDFVKRCVESANTMYGVDLALQRTESSVRSRGQSGNNRHRHGGRHWSHKCLTRKGNYVKPNGGSYKCRCL